MKPRLAALLMVPLLATHAFAGWNSSETVSLIDDSKNVYISAVAPYGIERQFGDTAWLTIYGGCQDGDVYFGVSLGDDIPLMGSRGFERVILRTDKDPAQTYSLSATPHHNALGVMGERAKSILQSLTNRKQLLVVVTPPFEPQVQRIVSLAGFDAALVKVRSACHW